MRSPIVCLCLILSILAARPSVSQAPETDAVDRHLKRVWKHLNKGRLEEAILELEKAQELASRDCRECLEGIGLGYLKVSKSDEALAIFEALFADAPGESTEVLRWLVQLYEHAGTPGKALAAYQAFTEHSKVPDELIHAYNELGFRFLATSAIANAERAEAAFRKALELSGGKSNIARKNLAAALWRLHRTDDASQMLDGLVSFYDDSWKGLREVSIPRQLQEKEREIQKARGILTGFVYVGGDVSPPEKISAPQPRLTISARQAGVQGVVIVRTMIDEKGHVVGVSITKGLPHGLNEETVEVIKAWRFRPATLNGQPVAVYYNLTVNFRLQ